ncbi:MAG: hypothetical protein BRC53_10395 [Cyanobacteria bacterium SW_6_48_11]|nr:MAG: hypothetical protein BRC53_10395 [Cyanobacteria bacterium SW_6_48_11]PSP20543.1 MAG: hypothetical protein BRC52_08275 [Cyanobacteria bacterium SW_5_48_44]
MRVNRFDSISQSYERAQGYLLQREAYHALILGLIDAVSKSPNRFTHPPYFATVEADDTILAVAPSDSSKQAFTLTGSLPRSCRSDRL